ncbi:sensor histidine kinase [Thermocrinis sp.]
MMLIDKFRSYSIGLKLSLTFIFVIIFCSLPLSFFIIGYLGDRLKQHIEHSIEEYVASQETELRNLILLEDYWKAFNKVESLSQIPGISEVLLVDSDYRIIASSKPKEHTVGRYFSYNPDYLKVPIMSYEYPVGYILFKLDGNYIKETILPLKLITIGVTLIFVFIGTFLGLFISIRINNRLKYIKDMIERFKAGVIPSKKEFWEKDELTELADFIHKDLSSLAQMLSNLNFARNFYESFFNSLQEVVLILDSGGYIYFSNRTIEDYGFSFEDLLGRRVDVLLVEPKARKTIRESIKRKSTFTGVVKLRNRNGKESYALLLLKPWEDAFICTLKDITELKMSEEYVKRMEVFSMLGEMSAHLAHELKNAMLPLKLMSEVDSWNEEDIKVVKTSVERIDKIVSNFFHFTRPVNDEKRRFSSLEMVEQILKLYEPLIKRKHIKLSLDVMDFELHTNKTAMEIILSNLLKNAIDAVDEEGNIKLSMKRLGERVLLTVEDDGQGIPEKLLKKIFDPFFSTKKDGTGLGLSTVMRYVQILEGKISVSSQEGKGTLFQLEVKA